MPSSAAAAIATLSAANLAADGYTALQHSLAAGNTAPAAYIDGLVSGLGFQVQDDGRSLGAASTTSGTFSDIGNGTTTGFTPCIFVSPMTKTYLVAVDTVILFTGSAMVCSLQLVNSTTSTNYFTNSMVVSEIATGTNARVSFRVPVAMTAGNNNLKLQWATNTGTLSVDANAFRTYTITG